MIDLARENPLVGVGARFVGVSENSYLYLFAAYGIFGLLLGLTLLFALLARAGQLWVRSRRETSIFYARMNEFVIALIGMFLFGSIFEGFLAARISVMVALGVIIMTMSSRLLKRPLESVDDQEHLIDYRSAMSYSEDGSDGLSSDQHELSHQSRSAQSPPA